jgi:protein SCO1
MSFFQTRILLFALITCQWAWAAPAMAETPGHHEKHFSTSEGTPKTQSKDADVHLFDLELVNQDGEPVRFKSDVIGDKLIIMDFVYTTCKTACPIQTAIFTRLQEELGHRLGDDVLLVSISIDPATDIPQRLKAYGQKHNAGSGWVWLTGKKLNVDQVLVGLSAYASDIVEHPSMILVGDGRHGSWTRFYGFPKIAVILNKLEELKAFREKMQPKPTHTN